MSTKSEGKLSLSTLVAIAAGNVIGAGVITTTGLAIAQTGRSAWISYGLAVLFGLLWLYPGCLWASFTKSRGGAYTQVSANMGKLAGGIYSLWWLPMFLMSALMGTALGLYVNSVLPILPVKWTGIIVSTIFFVINLFGVNVMSKIQKPLTWILILGLLAFVVIGLGHLNEDALNFSAPDYFMNGGGGLLNGLMLLIYSTSGHSLVTSLSWDAENPKKNIPLSIIITTGIILVLYMGVAFVAGNVLPVAEVAGQPLTYVAKAIFPGPLFIAFIVCGPIMALATSVNAGYQTMSAPVLGAIKNGWLPQSLAKTNKYGAPWIIYTFMWLLCVVPMLFGVSLSALTSYTVMTMRITSLLVLISALYIPKKFETEWKKSWMYMPNGMFYAIVWVAIITNIIAIFLNLRTLSASMFIANLAVVGALAVYGILRDRTGKTIDSSEYTFDD